MNERTDRSYEEELQHLRGALIDMAKSAVEMIGDSMSALAHHDKKKAQRTILLDREINQLDIDINAGCLVLIARRQPMGADLRFVTQAFKMVTDLERIGDLTVNICERTVQLEANPLDQRTITDDLQRMGAKVREMVQDAIDAFVEEDVEVARDVIDLDEEVDDLYNRIFKSTLKHMSQSADDIEAGIHVMSVAKVLERIGDHATNLAEQVVFMVGGHDIRHSGKLELT